MEYICSKLLKRSKMVLKYLVLIGVIIAVKAGKTNSEDDKKAKRKVLFEDTVKKRVVRLYDEKLEWKGTGYIVTLEALITPSENLLGYEGSIKFMHRIPAAREERKIGPNVSYNQFLSVALFDPKIKPRLEKYFPEVPFLEQGQISLLPDTMKTIGFSETHEKRIVRYKVMGVDYTEKIYFTSSTVKLKDFDDKPNNEEDASSSTAPNIEDDPNCFHNIRKSPDITSNAYSPRIGDVLITKDYLVGIMVRFRRNADIVSGEYFFYTPPCTSDIEKLKTTPAAAKK